MAESVVEFLRYGVHSEALRSAQASVKAAFLPGLVLAAHDEPQNLASILASVEDRHEVPRAFAYAELDYGRIRQNVEAERNSEVDSMEVDDELCWRDEAEVDECLKFEQCNESDRVELAVRSLRRRSGNHGADRNDMGSIWNNRTYLSDLRLLLPIAARRCPSLLRTETLVDGLLTAGCGSELLFCTLASNPNLVAKASSLMIECLKLDVEIVKQKPSGSRSRNAEKIKPEQQAAIWTLLKLCYLAPSFAQECRSILVEHLALAEMALLLTVEMIHDELEFLSGVLFKDQKISQWFLTYVSSNHRSSLPLPRLAEGEGAGTFEKEWLLSQLRKALLKDAREIKESKGWCPQLCAHIKVYSILVRTGEIQPIFEELDFWLRTLTADKAKGAVLQSTLELGVAFLCLVPHLTVPATRALYHGCVSYLLQPVKATESACTMELSVWLAVQLFLRRFSDIAEFVRDSLGMYVTVHNSSMRDLAESAVNSGITSEPSKLANAVATLRPQGALAGNVKKQARAVMCLEELLRSGTFARSGVDILDAVIHNIKRAREPVPQRLVQLIQVFVEGPLHQANAKCSWKFSDLRAPLLEIISPAVSACGKMSEGLDRRTSSARGAMLAPALLASFYILYREHLRRSTGLEEGKWWSDLIACVPWRRFLAFMESNQDSYEQLLPQWLSLAAALFPEKFLAHKILEDMEPVVKQSETRSSELDWVSDAPPDALSPGSMERACSDTLHEPFFVLCILAKMRQRALSYEWDLKEVLEDSGYWDTERLLIKQLMPALLDPLCPPTIQDYFCKWWRSLPDAAMEHLVIVFFESVKGSSPYAGLLQPGSALCYQSLVREPLIFLSCDPRLFRTRVLPVFLEMVTDILVINRRICESAVSEATGKDGGLKREEVMAALAVQDSAVCQTLLEKCLRDKALGDDEDARPLQAARQLVCATLASMFHTDSLLLKLVHFQGYNTELIQAMVDHIPAMEQCLEFLEELLQQPQEQKQIFAVVLASAVVSRFPEAKQSLPIAEKVVDHVVEVHAKVAGTASFLRQVLPAVSEIAVVFPSLAPKVLSLLQSCAQAGAALTRNAAARDPELETAAIKGFDRVAQKRILHGQLFWS